MHKLLETHEARIADVQVSGSPFLFLPALGENGPCLAFQVEEKDRKPTSDGKVGIHMVAYPCPEEFLGAVPDQAFSFLFTPTKLGEGAWVWEPQVVRDRPAVVDDEGDVVDG